MPDPNVTITAIETYANALQGAIRRSAANAGRCKVWSLAILAGVMVFAAGKPQMAALPWVAGVVVLLALADACQAVMARICTDAYNAFMRKLPLNGGNAMKAEECFVLPAPDLGWRQAGRVLGALGSFSVFPFYGALLALIMAFHVQVLQTVSSASNVSVAKAMPPATKPAQSVNSSLHMNVVPPARPASGQPGQAPSLSPLRPVPPQPGVRLPTVAPVRFPANEVRVQSSVPARVPEAGGTPALQPTIPGAAPVPAPAVPAGK